MATINTTTTTINTGRNINCSVTYTPDILRVTANTKTIVLDLRARDLPTATEEEIALVNSILDWGGMHKKFNVTLNTVVEMPLLASLRAKWMDELAHCEEVNKQLSESRPDNVQYEKVANVAAALVATHVPGTTYEETKLLTKDATVNALRNQTFSVLMYDIPETKNDDCPNPSRELWRIGCRMNKSVWLIPDSKINQTKELTDLWDEHKITYFFVPQDPKQNRVLSRVIQHEIDEEIRDLHTSLIESIENIYKKIGQLQDSHDKTEREMQKGYNTYCGQIRSHIRRKRESLETMIKCAEAFDQTENFRDLFAGLRIAIQEQVRTFNKLADHLGKKQV